MPKIEDILTPATVGPIPTTEPAVEAPSTSLNIPGIAEADTIPNVPGEMLAMADRILIVSKGKITAEFGREEATQEKLLHAATI